MIKKTGPRCFRVIGAVLVAFVIVCAQQSVVAENKSKVGGLKLQDRAFGLFATATHVNKDSTFTEYVNYSARFSLWVAAVTAAAETLVTAGTGNQLSHRPEWSPIHDSFEVSEASSFPQVEKITSVSYWDGVSFEGHKPLGLQVEQQVYSFKNSGFAILVFAITLATEAEPLEDLYVGFWSDVDAPDSEDRKSPTNDQIGFSLTGRAPFIFDSNVAGQEVPLLGAMILGVQDPLLSWWKAEEDPVRDAEHYAYLKGEVPLTDPTQPGDFRFLVSYGPFALKVDEVIEFPVVLVQANQVSDFEDNLTDAVEFFNEALGGASLAKSLASGGAQGIGAARVPQAFRLYPNFPNPFNPETHIQFDLPAGVPVELRIYNALGQLVRAVVDRPYPAGTFVVTWDGRDDRGQVLPSGIYIYKIKAGDFQAQRKLLLLK